MYVSENPNREVNSLVSDRGSWEIGGDLERNLKSPMALNQAPTRVPLHPQVGETLFVHALENFVFACEKWYSSRVSIIDVYLRFVGSVQGQVAAAVEEWEPYASRLYQPQTQRRGHGDPNHPSRLRTSFLERDFIRSVIWVVPSIASS